MGLALKKVFRHPSLSVAEIKWQLTYSCPQIYAVEHHLVQFGQPLLLWCIKLVRAYK